MRLRPHSISTQLVTLLLVPSLSLACLWMYSTYSSVHDALRLIRVADMYRYYGTPADQLADVLQSERRAAVLYAASGGRTGGNRLAALQRATDRRVAVLKDHAERQAGGTALSGDQKERLAQVLTEAADLGRLRRAVRNPGTEWSYVLDVYSSVIDPGFQLRGSLAALQTGQVARRGSVIIELARARELLSQEDAMVAAARAKGGMTTGEYRDFINAISGREMLQDIASPELPDTVRNSLEDFQNGRLGGALKSVELMARSAEAKEAAFAVQEGPWQRSVDDALGELGAIDSEAARDVGDEARSNGTAVVVRAGATSLAGLAAVLVSVLVSLRLSRRIARRLATLRDDALELSGNRLPEVMRRLRAGEDLDEEEVARAAPALQAGDDEIGQVGQAFSTAQRAAVRAAVEQERLRRGVSAVFTNLARRSQVLLHRQLTLLDTMQRRVQDPAELEDLFRLDHMTTRMRRHAEGLLILSGSAPGRGWRRPVRLAEVVRAAVGEVEDYPRVVVRRMPRVALAGPAVADVLHLLAELIENATAFSPPETKVTVRGAVVGGGFAVEIEDRGLGMNPERLAEANKELAEAAAGAELPESDRLGLFIVGRLAARRDVRVTLRHRRDDGTTAVVFIPAAVLADGAAGAEDVETGEFELRPRAVPEPAAPAGRPAPRLLPASAAAVADTGRERTGVGLPKRVRQTSLVPQLRDEPVHESPVQGPPTSNDRERSPEKARSTMTAFARGLARGRSAGALQSSGENGGSR